MSDEGYIKYQCIWNDFPIKIPEPVLLALNQWRKKLYDLSLIGAYDNGIGYGNISIRNDAASFFITGSATGDKSVLTPEEYALVDEWHFKKNQLRCTGKTKASSESLTHAAIYESVPEIRSVIHVHSEEMWSHFLNRKPTSSAEVEFGTPEMAFEIKRLLSDKEIIDSGMVVMGGHREGIISFGKNPDEAGNNLLNYYYQSLNNSTISDPDCK